MEVHLFVWRRLSHTGTVQRWTENEKWSEKRTRRKSSRQTLSFSSAWCKCSDMCAAQFLTDEKFPVLNIYSYMFGTGWPQVVWHILFHMPIQLANDMCECAASEGELVTVRPETMIDFNKLSYVNQVRTHMLHRLSDSSHEQVRSACCACAIIITVNSLSACRHMPCNLFSTSFLSTVQIGTRRKWDDRRRWTKLRNNCVKHETFSSRKHSSEHIHTHTTSTEWRVESNGSQKKWSYSVPQKFAFSFSRLTHLCAHWFIFPATNLRFSLKSFIAFEAVCVVQWPCTFWILN